MKKNNFEETTEEFIPFLENLSAVKVEAIASIILTLGYSISTLATIMAVDEAEAETLAPDNSKELKQIYKQLQNLNNRLDSMERKLNRY